MSLEKLADYHQGQLAKIEILKKALEDIKKHQSMFMNNPQMSTTYAIADKALRETAE